MQNALIVGVLVGLILPIIGVSVLYRRLMFIADSLGHINMSGIAFGVFITTTFSFLQPVQMFIAIIWTVLGAVLIEYLRNNYEHYKEMSILVVYSLSIALTMIFLSLSSGYNASLFNVLFGNINAISRTEVVYIAISIIAILLLLSQTYKKFLLFSIKEEHSKLYSINVVRYKYLSIILITLTISIAIKVVGVLLVSSLMTIPLITAGSVAKSLKKTVMYAIVISEFSIIMGIVSAYYLNVSTSAMIVIISLLCYLASLSFKKD